MKTKLLASLCLIVSFSGLNAQVTQLNNNNSLSSIIPLPNGKAIYYSIIDSSIWATDGTPGNTIQISTVKYADNSGYLNGKLYFTGITPATGAELYVSDGTAGGTSLVKDINPGTAGSDPGELTFLNGNLYFSAVTAAEGRELWKSDGTSGGTTLLKDIVAGAGSSNGSEDSFHLFSNGSYLLFAANTSSSGVELWKSDGTTGGTNLLKDINSGSDSSNPHDFAIVNGNVLFYATDATHGDELWKTDGTAGGTVLVKDINSGTGSSSEVELFPGFEAPVFLGFHVNNNIAFFNAYDGTSSNEVWATDGTSGNTILLKDFGGAPFTANSLIIDAVNYPTKIIFPFGDGTSRSELWQSDGTSGGTSLFKSFTPINAGETPEIYFPISVNFSTQTLTQPLFQGNKFFFVAGTAANGNELWSSDGTVGGTTMVKDIAPGTADGVNGSGNWLYTTTSMYFGANDGTHGNELWVTDGTSGGTAIVKDINPNAGDADPDIDPPFVSNGKIFFTATDGDDPTNTDLYVVNGTFTALPVTLRSFTVTPKNNDALLQWTIQQEINSKDYTVQRSYDGQHFQDIGSVPSIGTSASPNQYSFTDAGVMLSGKSIVYYRLNERDIDGRYSLTNIISLKISGDKQWNVRILSNPVQDNISLMLSNINGKLQLSVRDLNGRIIYTNSLENVNGQITLPVVLPSGMYLLESVNNNERKTIKFVK